MTQWPYGQQKASLTEVHGSRMSSLRMNHWFTSLSVVYLPVICLICSSPTMASDRFGYPYVFDDRVRSAEGENTSKRPMLIS